MIAGDRTQRNVKKSSTPVRKPRCHSRVGGNPWGTSLSGALVSFEDGCPARAKWIPAFAGMRGWPRATRGMGRVSLSTGMPVKAVSMRLSGHALPDARLDAVPGNAIKCRVDQAERIHRSSILRDLTWDKSKSCRGLGGWPTGWPRARATLGHLRGALIDPTDDTIARIYPATGVPRNRPFTLRSSSALGQWMPSPSPNSSHSARCSGDARRRRGNQASGAEMRRPSARTTVNSSSVTSTCRARGLYSTAKELMPLLQKNLVVIGYQPHKLAQFICGKTTRRRQGNWLEPELGEGAITLHMDMRWLAAFVTKKEETIRADAIQGWHFACQFVVLIESNYTLRWIPENVCVPSGEL